MPCSRLDRCARGSRPTAWRSSSGRAISEPGETTLVEVRFAAANGGTEVLLEHSGWDALRRDHPVRHGLADPAFARMRGGWWLDQLRSLRRHA